MNKEIRIMMEIEVPGLVDTITNNTSDYYVKNYASNLLTRSYPEDQDLLLVVIQKLLEWYNGKMDQFRGNEYRYTFDIHEKSINVLNRLQQLIQDDIKMV